MTHPQYVLRPVHKDDFDEVFRLITTIGDGLTSLPLDPENIAHRIDDSQRAFDPLIRKPGGETYLFVLEDLETGKIIGTSGLLSRVGGFEPFYTYEMQHLKHEYAPLKIQMELKVLHLRKNHKGPTEICSLFLHKDYRSGGLGKLLSLSRFCFMKTFKERFDETILAELRGFINEDGKSPFWEAVGRKFFRDDYSKADILSGLGEKEFIETLMPEYPIYVSLLPKSARKVIGKVHDHTRPARKILFDEGFTETNEIDIFDAGPILTAPRSELRTWKESRLASLLEGNPDAGCSRQFLLMNQSLDFRAIRVNAQPRATDELIVSAKALSTLGLLPGEQAMCLPMETT